MMFTEGWKGDWHTADGDTKLSGKLILVFEEFLAALHEKGVAKSTFKRHRTSCLAIGGYIIDQVFNYQFDTFEDSESGEDILLRYLDGCDGPLIYQDNESWQREVDATSRKLYKFIKNNNQLL